MQPPELTVKEAFAIPGHGAGIHPEQGLPPQFFGLSFEVEWTAPDGTPRTARGSVESPHGSSLHWGGNRRWQL